MNATFERGDVVRWQYDPLYDTWVMRGRILALDTDNQVFIVRNMAGTTDRVSVFEVKKLLPTER
jgi:hypothetical protein